MKIARLLIVAALLGISCTAALADSTDPILFTKGCGGKGQPACDAFVLTASNLSIPITLTFADIGGQEIAQADIINDTGKTLSDFTVSFDVNPGLSFTGCQTGGFFTCTPLFSGPVTSGIASFSLTGNSLCSTDSNDWINGVVGGTFRSDDDADDSCTFGFTLGLLAGSNDTVLTGEKVFGTVSAPETSSGLFLAIGLLSALVVLKRAAVNA